MKFVRKFLHLAINRLPFTLIMLALLILAAWITETNTGKLSLYWINRLGFSPQDLFLVDLWRMVTSALITDGGRTFWIALWMVLIALGSAEWYAGTLHAIVTFWGVHLLTLLIQSLLIVWPVHLFSLNVSTALLLTRDIGPSAGYFACLGLAINCLPKPWNWLIGLMVLAGLFVVFFTSYLAQPVPILQLSADMAHLIAFPFGWLSGMIKFSPGARDNPLTIQRGQ
jgi:hypothetical protein